MLSIITVVHIIVAAILIVLVLVQDSKNSSAFGGSTSNSILGPTGATTLAAKLTRWTAVVFAFTCLMLTYYVNKEKNSESVISNTVIEQTAAPATAPTQDATATTAAPNATPTADATQTNTPAPEAKK